MNRILPAILLTATLPGCTAIRSTVHLTRAEQAYALAVDAEAETWAPYAHERAHSLLLKAREEPLVKVMRGHIRELRKQSAIKGGRGTASLHLFHH